MALVGVRRQLRKAGSQVKVRPAPPRLGDGARRGVSGVMRRLGATCLEEALVLQAWDSAHGREQDVVIGITGSVDSLRAHAWLAGSEDAEDFEELTRWPAASRPTPRRD